MGVIPLKIHHQPNNHAERRRQEYPVIGDQLDAVYKLARHMQEQGQQLPPDVEQWVAQCRAVKEKVSSRLSGFFMEFDMPLAIFYEKT